MNVKKVLFRGEVKHNSVTAFALAELRKYAPLSAAPGWTRMTTVELSITQLELNPERDEFCLSCEQNCVKVIASHARALLYAVYTLLEELAGLRWYHVGETTITSPNGLAGRRVFSHDFCDRGLMLETAYTPADIIAVIDWAAKNRINSIMIPFYNWDKIETEVAPELACRGLNLTLGGHSYFRFLPAERYFATHPEWYALIDGRRQEKSQLCFSNATARQTFFANVAAYLHQHPTVSRLSIWPADNRFYCQCPTCRKKSFLEHYATLMADLQDYLQPHGISATIEYLAYNAALSETMLRPPDDPDSAAKLDTLLAYWGRDYAHSLAAPATPADRRAQKIVLNWTQVHQAKSSRLRILEYYTDFWMLTSLYPPLTKVIFPDLKFYREQGVTGIFTLGVACNYGFWKDRGYPWRWRQGLNLYLFARAAIFSAADPVELLNSYYNNYYGPHAEDARRVYEFLERVLAPLSAFNIPLFRLRALDLWKQDPVPGAGGRAENVLDWTPEIPPTADETRRDEYFARVKAEFDAFTPIKPDSCPGWSALTDYFDYARQKINSLYWQTSAQHWIRTGQTGQAVDCLSQALELEAGLYGEDTEVCRSWLARMKVKNTIHFQG